MKISVVIPLYNKRATIRRALDSVRAQTVSPFEVLVVDDGSTDGGAEQVAAMACWCRLIRQQNAGVSAARNRGARECCGDWVAFLDADDEWLPGFLAAITTLVRAYPAAGLCAAAYFLQPPGGVRRRNVLRGLPVAFQSGIFPRYFYVAAQSAPPVCSSAVAVRRDRLLMLGGFPEGVAVGEDLLTWARFAAAAPLAYTREPLAVFHQDEGCVRARRPSREPDPGDPVGAGLRKLMNEANNRAAKQDLAGYLAHWHNMRANMYLRLGDPCATRTELWQGLALRPCSARLHAYMLISYLSEGWRNRLQRRPAHAKESS